VSARALTLCAVLSLAALALGAQLAVGAAEYQGSDPISNVSPGSGVKDGEALINRHPIGHYALDVDVKIGLTNLGEVIGGSGQSVAAAVWDLTVTINNAVISLFAWAFTLDLLEGGGLLAPVAAAINAIHTDVLGREWMVVAVVLMTFWAMWRALIQQRYAETAGTLGISLLFAIIALFFVTQPALAVGQVSRWTNDMSMAFLSITSEGDIADPEAAKEKITDRLFESLIYDPWIVLNFGGMSHCVSGDEDEPKPVDCADFGERDPRGVTKIDHKVNQGGQGSQGGYANAFLYWPPRTEERTELFDALAAGDEKFEQKAPEGQPAPGPVAFTAADKPAADIALAALGWQRAAMAVLILVASLGAAALIGMLSLAVILAQFVALLLLMLAPVALIVGMVPGRGHEFFRAWLGKLGLALVIKAAYSLILALVLVVASALLGATAKYDWLLGYVLVAAFYWGIFLYRKQISGALQKMAAGRSAGLDRVSRDVARPVSAMASTPQGFGRRGLSRPRRPGADPANAGAGGHGARAGVLGLGAPMLAGRARRRLDRQAADDGLVRDAERERKREARGLAAKPLKSEADRDRLAYLRGPGAGGTAAREAGKRTRRRELRDTAGLDPHTRAERRTARRAAGDSARARANGNVPASSRANGAGPAAAGAGLGAAAGAGAARGQRGRRATPPPPRTAQPRSPRAMLASDDRARADRPRPIATPPPPRAPGGSSGRPGRKPTRQAIPRGGGAKTPRTAAAPRAASSPPAGRSARTPRPAPKGRPAPPKRSAGVRGPGRRGKPKR